MGGTFAAAIYLAAVSVIMAIIICVHNRGGGGEV